MLKTQIFEKKHSFQGMKKFRLFFSHYRTRQIVSEQNLKVHKVFWQVWCNLLDLFLGPKKTRTKFFKIKAFVPKKKKILGHFFSYYPLWQTLSILFYDSTRYLGNSGASYKVISLGPKRFFKTKFFWKSATFSVKKCNCPMFSQIVESEKPQETIYKCHKKLLTTTVEVITSFLGSRRLLKTQNFEKKSKSSSEQM